MEFETLLADAFRLDGYAVDHCRRRGPDGGVDLRLRREGETTLVQCKHWKAHQVGVAAARELLGLVVQQRASGGILVTSGSFSDEARRFAATTAVQLVDASLLGSLLRRTTSQPQGQNVQVQSASTPSCPFCGAVTVQRRSRYGRFYGCSRYPRCRGIVDDSRVAAS
jgi:restriction system protein